MYINRRFALLLALCLIILAGVLSGCVPGKTAVLPDPDQSVSAPTQQATPEESAAPAATPTPAASTPEADPESALPDVFPMEFGFSSGAGAWGTSITLRQDGTFQGQYSDSEMGDSGKDYPHGTVYRCDFSGRFDEIQKIDECTYSMTLSELAMEGAVGDEEIRDQIRYVTQNPYGFESGKTFLLYTPSVPLEGLSEDFLSWWPDNWLRDEQCLTELGRYGIYNQETGYGFFSSPLDTDTADEA